MAAEGNKVIEYEINAFDSKYFNELVMLLPKYHVSEIRPFQKIWISNGIETSQILPHLNDMINHIESYNLLRKNIFNQFLNHLDITDIEGNFYKLRVRLQKTNEWPRGVFKEWSYWSHGGDIEFDNESTNEHFNVAMSNIRSLKYWSLHKFILGTNKESELGILLLNRKETILKMFDVLVIKKKLYEIRTEFGEKQYELS